MEPLTQNAWIPLYTSEQIRLGEAEAASQLGIEMFELMERAGLSAFQSLQRHYPDVNKLLVVCGSGNNGGDGYVLAHLAQQAGYQVQVFHIGDAQSVTGDTAKARSSYQGIVIELYDSESPWSMLIEELERAELIIDAILGTGLSGPVRELARRAIEDINCANAPVLSLDLPSGLASDTGESLVATVIADRSVSFVGYKQGCFTGQARDFCGCLELQDLQIGQVFYELNPAASFAGDANTVLESLPKRPASGHKGKNGRALVVGGDRGMSGALCLAVEAALRSGAGLVAAQTDNSSITPTLARCPEAMVASWDDIKDFISRLEWAKAVAIGPGLGLGYDSQRLFDLVCEHSIAKVFDADALTLLSYVPTYRDDWILTPHPGEAARLLGMAVSEVEADRFFAVRAIQRRYGGVVVLKGAGTLVYDGKAMRVCTLGNAGMAVGGMGDVLTGIIVSLLAQGLSLSDAAWTGVVLHSQAADDNTEIFGQIGLRASDVAQQVRQTINALHKRKTLGAGC